ncbi:MAG: oligosaccharide flippase family protein [Methanolinea sp.]|nr:oligosaccharide flippase family protein [Methanolinea sp.]
MITPSRIAQRLLSVDPVRRQALLSFLSNAGVTVLGFLATIYIAHAAGAGVLGAFFLLLSYYSIAAIFCDGGFGAAMVRKVATGEEMDAYFSAHAAARIALTALAVAAVLFSAPLLRDASDAGLIPWLALALAVGSASGILGAELYARGSLGIVQAGEFLGTVVRILAQVAAVALGWAVAGMAGGFVAGLAATLAVNARFARPRWATFSRRHLAGILPDALSSLGAALAAVAAGWADTIVLGYYLDPAAVGYYRTPLQLASLSLFVATALSASLYPRASRWHAEGDVDRFRRALARALSYSLLLAVPLACGGIALSERLLYFLYGADFVVAAPAFSLLLLAQVGSAVSLLDGMALYAAGRTRAYFLLHALSCAALVLLLVSLVPPLGITGAAAAVLLASTGKAVASRIALRRATGAGAEAGTLARILAAGLATGALAALLQWLFPPAHVAVLAGIVLSGAAFYFALIFRLEPGLRGEILALAADLGIPRSLLPWRGPPMT